MRLTKGLKSFLCCLVIISVAVVVCQGPAWAESFARQAVKAARIKQGNPAPIKPAIKYKSLAGAVANAVNNGATQGNKRGAIAAALANAANKASALPKRGAIANALANAANKAVALPKSTPKMNLKGGRPIGAIGAIVGGVVGKTVKMPSLTAVKAPRIGKIMELNSPAMLKGKK